ncbi:V-type ATP synthase subunit D [Spirilliplanes yamanashiensis]|uniref:V-type ATPase, D subunit n=1 Tax=Spirilliplanes yamanashiensis TaxID=42233 RepID=A0A8J3YEY4_9ACTN|nr:V-type ATP synthase subunit D [Spirilliplanes yamanashiensis]MDP9818277.1 V/A-type H+-transporting ATPase subunit D [Spirilliplanes yamanashiensis]GIJ06695.1 hypothetical protein Sya03_60470 [Spirilliplanes yamanashiensis]
MTAPVPGAPPGRAGVLWLRRRLAAADAGAGLLTRKLVMLTAEARRRDAEAHAAEDRWRALAAEAGRRLERAGMIDGDAAVTAAGGPATVDVRWATLLGVRYPATATCAAPARPPGAAPAGGSAALQAEAAVRAALPAAARCAAAARAAAEIDREVTLTRQRLRALQRRWIPRLAAALRSVQAQIEEAEAADAVRRRWAAGARRSGGSGPPALSAARRPAQREG